MTDTLYGSQRQNYELPANSRLTITAGAGSTGYISRVIPGQQPSSPQQIAASSKTVTGPFPYNTHHLVECLGGSLTVLIDETTFPTLLLMGKLVPFTGNRSLQLEDNGSLLRCEDTGNVTITVPGNLPEGFNVGVLMWGSGTVTTAAGSGATNRSAKSALGTEYNVGSVIVCKNVDGASAEYILGGDFA